MPGAPPYQEAEGGGKLPAFGEDFFQRIVGVQWEDPFIFGEGLAVEFYPRDT